MDSKKLIALLKQYPVAVASLGGALLFGLLLYFTMDTLDEREARYLELEQELDVIRQNDINAFGLPEEVDQAKSIVETIDRRLMLEDAKASHYQYFLGLAEASGAGIDDPVYGNFLNPGARGITLETKEYGQIEYSLRFRGSFQEVLDFLYLLQTGEHFMRVTRMRLGSQQQAQERDRVQGELLIRVLAPKQEEKK